MAVADDAVSYVDALDLLAKPKVRKEVEALAAAEPHLVAHRAKELTHGLELDLRSLDHDTAVMAYLLDPGEGKYLLEDLARRYLSLELTSPDREEGTLDLDGDVGVEDTQRRAALLLRASSARSKALDARELTDLYERIELPLVRVLARMEDAGIRIDLEFLNELGKELNDECRRLEAEIHAHAGEQFNVNSTPQLRRILFEKLGLTPVKKTKTGPRPTPTRCRRWPTSTRSSRPCSGTARSRSCAAPTPTRCRRSSGADGRIHATFNQLATTTGRISSESPNLQNVPVRTAGGRELRRVHRRRGLRSPHGRLLADRAARARAPRRRPRAHRRVRARRRRAHHHRGARVRRRRGQGRRVPAAVRQGRQLRPGVRHGGVRPRAAPRHPHRPGREILDAYFAAFPNVAGYMHETIREAKACGYTTTLFGRRRQLPELSSDNFRIRQMGERMAQNAPVQGARPTSSSWR